MTYRASIASALRSGQINCSLGQVKYEFYLLDFFIVLSD